MKLKFLLDYTDSPLWANDAATESKFGYNITDLAGLGLKPDTIDQIHLMMEMFGEMLNPVYQGYPSFWSGRMFALFQRFANKVYQQLLDELGESVEVENREKAFLTEPIEVEKIDMELLMFLADPAKFSDENGVVYGSKEALKLDVDAAYGVWVEKEMGWVEVLQS